MNPFSRHPAGMRFEAKRSSYLLAIFAFALVLSAAPSASGADAALQFDLHPAKSCPPLGGAFSGIVDGHLLVAGGAYFNTPPHQGGKKIWTDQIVLLNESGEQKKVGRLPHALAYGAAVTTPKGLVLAGGCDADRHYDRAYLLTVSGNSARLQDLPALPKPVAYLDGACLGNKVFVAGGQDAPDKPQALKTFWMLDLDALEDGWEELEPWPGPARMLPSVAAAGGQLLVFCGAELSADQQNQPVRRYLTDGYAYTPGQGWTPMADMPHPAVAAPVVVWSDNSIVVFGGDNGKLADKGSSLGDKHPGFNRAVLGYDLAADSWTTLQQLPNLPVTTKAHKLGDTILIPSGEDRPGHRMPLLYMLGERAEPPLHSATRGEPAELFQTDVWTSGQGGYNTYRIPALTIAANGDLLAFCEGRKGSASDTGDIDLLIRRSSDGGKTWTEPKVIVDSGPNTSGNPCPVLDRKTGRLLLTMTQNLGQDREREIIDGKSTGTRTVWIMHSDDHGVTWSERREITAQTKRADWTWYATGPGIGIQLQSGRLLIPCDHVLAGSKAFGSHAIYSDDGGDSWQIGGVVPDRVNECQAAELDDGSVLLNMRSYHQLFCRAVARSTDGGASFGPLWHHPALIEPVCQAGLLRVRNQSELPGDCLLFSNPADRVRRRMTVRLSSDGGDTWPVHRVLHEGPTAYSCLAQLPDGKFACLYERGQRNPYEKITLAVFNLAWLDDR